VSEIHVAKVRHVYLLHAAIWPLVPIYVANFIFPKKKKTNIVRVYGYIYIWYSPHGYSTDYCSYVS